MAVLAQVALGTCFRHGLTELGPHLIGAFLVAFFILAMALAVIYGTEHARLRLAAQVFLAIAALQILLGFILLTMQSMDADPPLLILVTILHATTGALTLAATLALALLIRRCLYAGSGPPDCLRSRITRQLHKGGWSARTRRRSSTCLSNSTSGSLTWAQDCGS